MRTSLLASCALALFLAAPALAVPVAPVPAVVTQPDGTKVTVVPVGDEFNLYWELPDGSTVLRDAQGWWRRATLDGEGRLVAGGPKVGEELARAAQPARRHLRPSKIGYGPGERAPIPAGSRSPELRALATGVTQPVLVILVEFSDRAPIRSTASEFQQSFFAASNSVTAYFNASSYGKIAITPVADSHGGNDGVVGWLKLSMKHPNRGISGSDSATEQEKKTAANLTRQAIRAAILAADPYVNFAAYDRNGDGGLSVDEISIVVITAGYEASYGGYSTAYSPANWGHRWVLGGNDGVGVVDAPVVDGVRVAFYGDGGGYSSFGEIMKTFRSTIGVMVHELGHDALGLPDLYDTDKSSSGVGSWCLMSGGSWGTDRSPGSLDGDRPVMLSAWSRLVTGISRATDLRGAGTVTATPVATTPQLFRIGSGADNEYFLLEYRAPVGWDAGLKRWDSAGFAAGGGLAVWHIDGFVGDNKNEEHKMVDLEEADGLAMLDLPIGSASRSQLFYDGAAVRFADDTNPNAKRYDDTETGVVISAVGAPSASGITFSYQAPAPVGVANDDCEDAIEVRLAPGEQREFAEQLVQAAGGDTPPLCTTLSNTAWYRVRPQRSGTLTIQSSGFDTVAAVLDGTCGGPFEVLACDDDGLAAGGGSKIDALAVQRDEDVLVVIGAWGQGNADGLLAGHIALAAGNPLTVSAAASGSCPGTRVEVEVRDAMGAAIDGLTLASFRSFLDGAEVTPRQFQASGGGRYSFALDTGGVGTRQGRVEVDRPGAAGDGAFSVSCPGTIRRRLVR